jgi:hypothetical protein
MVKQLDWHNGLRSVGRKCLRFASTVNRRGESVQYTLDPLPDPARWVVSYGPTFGRADSVLAIRPTLLEATVSAELHAARN